MTMVEMIKFLTLAFSMAAGLSIFPIAQAQIIAEETTLSDIASCRQITKSNDRLRCFDRATKFLDETTMTPHQKTADKTVLESDTANATTDLAIDPVARFGAEDLLREDQGEQLENLRAVATTIRTNKLGKFIIELDNGQIWRQLSGDTKTLRVRRDKDGTGHDVIIKKRSLGAYTLRLTTSKKSILVRRIK